MNIQPVTFRIVVKPLDVVEQDEVLSSARKLGIHLPDLQREQEGVDQGVVEAIGPIAFKAYDTENPLAVGDTIVFARHAGKKVLDPITKEPYVILNDEDVVAILKKGA